MIGKLFSSLSRSHWFFSMHGVRVTHSWAYYRTRGGVISISTSDRYMTPIIFQLISSQDLEP